MENEGNRVRTVISLGATRMGWGWGTTMFGGAEAVGPRILPSELDVGRLLGLYADVCSTTLSRDVYLQKI